MKPSAKAAGSVCLAAGLAVGALIGSLVSHRVGRGRVEEGKRAENAAEAQGGGRDHVRGREEGDKPAERAGPEASTFIDPPYSLLAEFARGSDGLSALGPAKSVSGKDALFDPTMTRYYLVLSRKLTLHPKFKEPISTHIRELDRKLIALAREKGVVLKAAGDGHDVRQLDGGPQTVGPADGKHIFVSDAREGFRYQYSAGQAHGVVQVQLDYQGKQGKGDEEVAVYYYEARVEEWSPALKP
jgi:hypothetical protein